MSLAKPVFNLKTIEFGAFFAYFRLCRHLKSDTTFPKICQNILFSTSFQTKKNRLKITLQVSKLGFSPIVMPKEKQSLEPFSGDGKIKGEFLHSSSRPGTSHTSLAETLVFAMGAQSGRNLRGFPYREGLRGNFSSQRSLPHKGAVKKIAPTATFFFCGCWCNFFHRPLF